MIRAFLVLAGLICACGASAAEPPGSAIGKVFDRDLTSIERDIVPLAIALHGLQNEGF